MPKRVNVDATKRNNFGLKYLSFEVFSWNPSPGCVVNLWSWQPVLVNIKFWWTHWCEKKINWTWKKASEMHVAPQIFSYTASSWRISSSSSFSSRYSSGSSSSSTSSLHCSDKKGARNTIINWSSIGIRQVPRLTWSKWVDETDYIGLHSKPM